MKKPNSASAMTKKVHILVLHGPNLNLLGTREPEHYGRLTLADINQALQERAQTQGITLDSFQSNHEGALVERIHAARSRNLFPAIIINPAAYTDTSVAIRGNALAGVAIRFVEFSPLECDAREAFRHHSIFLTSPFGVICGRHYVAIRSLL